MRAYRVTIGRSSIALSLMLVWAGTASTAHGQDPETGPRLSLRVAKGTYIEGEPVALEIAVDNPGPVPLRIENCSPTWLIDAGTLRFDLKDMSIPVAPSFDGDRLGLTTYRKVSVGGHWQRTVFLQRVLRPLKAGAYCLPYQLEFGCLSGVGPGPKDIEGTTLRARGTLAFTVTPADPERLREVFRAYVDTIENDDDWDAIDRAFEALSHVTDPRIIEMLAHLAVMEERGHVVIDVLRYFRHFPKTLEIVRGALNSRDNMVVAKAISTLAEWREPIEPAVTARLGKIDNFRVADALSIHEDVMRTPPGKVAPSLQRPWIFHMSFHDVRPLPLPRPIERRGMRGP